MIDFLSRGRPEASRVLDDVVERLGNRFPDVSHDDECVDLGARRAIKRRPQVLPNTILIPRPVALARDVVGGHRLRFEQYERLSALQDGQIDPLPFAHHAKLLVAARERLMESIGEAIPHLELRFGCQGEVRELVGVGGADAFEGSAERGLHLHPGNTRPAVIEATISRSERLTRPHDAFKLCLAQLAIAQLRTARGRSLAIRFAGEVEALVAQLPNWSENSDEQRRLRLSLYKPLLGLGAEDRARIVETTMSVLSEVERA